MWELGVEEWRGGRVEGWREHAPLIFGTLSKQREPGGINKPLGPRWGKVLTGGCKNIMYVYMYV